MNNIKVERARINMSQQDLAEALGVGVTSIVRWEKSLDTCSLKNILEMSGIFDCSIDYLVGRTDLRGGRFENRGEQI